MLNAFELYTEIKLFGADVRLKNRETADSELRGTRVHTGLTPRSLPDHSCRLPISPNLLPHPHSYRAANIPFPSDKTAPAREPPQTHTNTPARGWTARL